MATPDVAPICSVCSCQTTGDGNITIHDQRKWMCSPDPCPECRERWQKRIAARVKNAELNLLRALFRKTQSEDCGNPHNRRLT